MINAVLAGASSRLIQETQERKEQERAKKEAEKAKREAASLCEGIISMKIQEAARAGRTFITVYFERSLFSNYCYLLREKRRAYANGKSSWRADSDAFSLQEMLRILNSAGYTTSISEENLYCYGFGAIDGYSLRIQY